MPKIHPRGPLTLNYNFVNFVDTSVIITFRIRLSELPSSELSCGSGKGGNLSDPGLPIKLFVIINVIYLLTGYPVRTENYYMTFD